MNMEIRCLFKTLKSHGQIILAKDMPLSLSIQVISTNWTLLSIKSMILYPLSRAISSLLWAIVDLHQELSQTKNEAKVKVKSQNPVNWQMIQALNFLIRPATPLSSHRILRILKKCAKSIVGQYLSLRKICCRSKTWAYSRLLCLLVVEIDQGTKPVSNKDYVEAKVNLLEITSCQAQARLLWSLKQ